jgi:hypothetical protein
MRTSLEITADSIVNLERRPRDEDGSFNSQPTAGAVPAGSGVRPQRAPSDDTDLDDLPF